MSDLKGALESVQKILRELRLPHLAAQVPVNASSDLPVVLSRIRIIDGLLRLHPPSDAALDRLRPSMKALTDLAKKA